MSEEHFTQEDITAVKYTILSILIALFLAGLLLGLGVAYLWIL